jgi:hypothetical protein
MLPKVQVFAIEGFEDAIIGTAYRGGHEVLVYDGWLFEAIAALIDPNSTSIHEYLTKIRLHELGDRAPVLVYLDEEVVGELADSIRDPNAPVH